MNTAKPISKLIEQYLSERDFTDTTLETYRKVLPYFFYYLRRNDEDVDRPKRSDIISYKRELKARGLSTSTIDLYLVSLKGYFRWLSENDYYDNIVGKVRIETRHRHFRKKILESSQVKQLIGSVDTSKVIGIRDKAMINLMYTCGLRRIEIHRLNLSDLDPSTNTLYVQGKGYTDRTPVSIMPATSDLIADYVQARIDAGEEVDNQSPMFVAHTSRNLFPVRLTAKSISALVRGRMEKAGLHTQGLSAHSLRHSAAVALIESGSSLYEVSIFLRHSSMDISRHYTRYIEQKLASQKRPQGVLQRGIM